MKQPIDEHTLNLMLTAARGDVAVFFLLVALRRTENGGPGKEMGILDPRCTTLEEQIQWASNTIRNNVGRYEVKTGHQAREKRGLFTEEFIRYFSGVYAPIGAMNDATNLNVYHARNLLYFHQRCQTVVREAA